MELYENKNTKYQIQMDTYRVVVVVAVVLELVGVFVVQVHLLVFALDAKPKAKCFNTELWH